MAAAQYEIAADISDDDEDLVATSSQGLLPTHNAPAQDKGKGRATSPALEGRIGGSAGGQAGGSGARGQRHTTFGGIQTETRCVEPTLSPAPSLARLMRRASRSCARVGSA